MGKPKISIELESRVVDLRQRGYSIPEIHRILSISKSTVLRYCHGIEILPEYRNRWLERRNASKIISERAKNAASLESVRLVDGLTDKDLMIFGAALYWAEGAKKELSFINSDPEMIRLFVHILKNVFRVPLKSIRISLRLFEDMDFSEAIGFWSKITEIELDKNTYIEVRKGSKQGKLVYGMCRVKVKKGGLLLKKIFAINRRVISLISPRSSTDRAAAS